MTKVKNEKIDKIEKQYQKDIKEIIDNIDLINNDILEIENDIRKYSTFKVSMIGKILELLMNIMEVKKYEVKNGNKR